MSEPCPRAWPVDAIGGFGASLRRRADRCLLLGRTTSRFPGAGEAAGVGVSDAHRNAPDWRARRSQATGRLRRLWAACLLCGASDGDAAGLHEDGQSAESDSRSDENLWPLRAPQVLLAVRVSVVRENAERTAPVAAMWLRKTVGPACWGTKSWRNNCSCRRKTTVVP